MSHIQNDMNKKQKKMKFTVNRHTYSVCFVFASTYQIQQRTVPIINR